MLRTVKEGRNQQIILTMNDTFLSQYYISLQELYEFNVIRLCSIFRTIFYSAPEFHAKKKATQTDKMTPFFYPGKADTEEYLLVYMGL